MSKGKGLHGSKAKGQTRVEDKTRATRKDKTGTKDSIKTENKTRAEAKDKTGGKTGT